MKFHVEHFTCSVCSTIFGPQDSYYEHGGQVYCHFHYSTRFAVKCPGCQTAILKQFVEINRDDVDEHLHPECYLIQKFWNIKLVTSAKKQIEASPATVQAGNSGDTASSMEHSQVGVASTLLESMGKANVKDQILSSRPSVSSTSVDWSAQEASETARTLREQQQHAEAQVSRTWTVLSSFEESAAACISNLLCYMSNGRLSEGMQMAEDFVLHVETLFAAIDDLSDTFRTSRSRGEPDYHVYILLATGEIAHFSLQIYRTSVKLACSVKSWSTCSLFYRATRRPKIARWKQRKNRWRL